MKIAPTAVLSSLLLLAQGRATLSTPDNEIRAPEVCGYPTVALLQAVSDSLSDRIFTTDPTEVEAALASGQYIRSAVLATVYSNTTGPNVPNAIPIYRVYNAAGTDHYLTTSWSEVQAAVDDNGYEYQGVIGYAYSDTQADCAGTIPFYRTYDPKTPDHYYTTNLTNRNNAVNKSGYVYEGITAYVFAPS